MLVLISAAEINETPNCVKIVAFNYKKTSMVKNFNDANYVSYY